MDAQSSLILTLEILPSNFGKVNHIKTKRRSLMKTIGILGGISALATMDFEKRVHQVSERLIPAHGNTGYPTMVSYFHRGAPMLTKDGIAPVIPLEPDPEFLRAAQWLGTKADFLVITANGPHRFQDRIAQASGRKVLSMIEATLEEVRRRDWKKVGVLGFPDPSSLIYTQPLSALGIECEVIDAKLQARLNQAVVDVMAGRLTPGIAQEALEVLRQKGVDGIIPGCTEIPLLLGNDINAPDLVNPIQLLAEAAVKFSLEDSSFKNVQPHDDQARLLQTGER
jgi:aspartate racemase